MEITYLFSKSIITLKREKSLLVDLWEQDEKIYYSRNAIDLKVKYHRCRPEFPARHCSVWSHDLVIAISQASTLAGWKMKA